MKPYPVEYRHRVVQLTADGYSTSAVAAALGTSAAWVRSIKALHRSGQPPEPKSPANRRRSLAAREGGRIRARVADKPGTTLDDLRRDLGLKPSLSNLWNALRDLKLSLKKKSLRAAERDRPDVAASRAEWAVAAAGLDPRRLVFLDETFGTTAMTRLYGWGPTHERVVGIVPHGHWKTTTFVAAFRLGGLFAPLVVDGALSGDLFAQYVRQELAPHLRSGDILVMDTLQTHKVAGVVEAVQARDARVLFLPPYSPDLNPIEQVFSKIKNELRRRELRTIAALEDAFGESLDWITRTEALHYFENSGYTLVLRCS